MARRSWGKDMPPEVIIHIAKFNAYNDRPCITPCCCRKEYPLFERELRGPSHLRDTMRTSHVCREWYHALVGSPGLWTHFIDPHHRQKLTKVLLHRTQPLGIRFMFTEPNVIVDDDTVDTDMLVEPTEGPPHFLLEMSHANRLTHYSFPKASDVDWNQIPHSWPELRFLCINIQGANLLRGDFPGVATPRLEGLHLHNVLPPDISQITRLSSTLTHLRVSYSVGSQSFLNGWFRAIRSLPLLTRLVLKEKNRTPAAFIGRTPYIPQSPPHILHLEEFRFLADIASCVQVLREFDLSHTSRVFIMEIVVTPKSSHYLEEITQNVVPIFEKIGENPLFESCMLELCPGEIRVMGLGEELEEDGEDEYNPLDLSDCQDDSDFTDTLVGLSFHIPNDVAWGEKECKPIIATLEIFIDRVEYVGFPDFPEDLARFDYWDILMSKGSRIRFIRQANFNVWNVLHRIMLRCIELNPAGLGDFLLPKLKGMHMGYSGDEPSIEFCNCALQFCYMRRSCGRPLSDVEIHSSDEPYDTERPSPGLQALIKELQGMDIVVTHDYRPLS